jgi:hypothetical protein
LTMAYFSQEICTQLAAPASAPATSIHNQQIRSTSLK